MATTIPPHRVIESVSLLPNDGRRIRIAVDSLISPDQCRALVAQYRKEATPGQVVVTIPGTGALCVENFDGRGTVVHDFMWAGPGGEDP
jgi:hypothetical protein